LQPPPQNAKPNAADQLTNGWFKAPGTNNGTIFLDAGVDAGSAADVAAGDSSLLAYKTSNYS